MEKKAAKITDEISKIGANVITLSSKNHLLNHASQEDLMLMLNLMNPKYYFPVKMMQVSCFSLHLKVHT